MDEQESSKRARSGSLLLLLLLLLCLYGHLKSSFVFHVITAQLIKAFSLSYTENGFTGIAGTMEERGGRRD